MKPDYQIKQVKLYNVDCMEFMKTIPDNYYELAIVDPPYGIGYCSKSNDIISRGKPQAAELNKYNCFDDSQKPDKEYFDELLRVSKNQIVFGGQHYTDMLPQFSGWIVWDKIPSGCDNQFSGIELCWTSFNKSIKRINYKWQGMLQGNMAEKEHRIHPTQKPTEIYKWILANYAECKKCNGLGHIDVPTIRMDCDVSTCPDCKGKEAKIFDSHGGSFSSACACLDMGFEFDGCEIDKEYFDNAVERLKNNVQDYLDF